MVKQVTIGTEKDGEPIPMLRGFARSDRKLITLSPEMIVPSPFQPRREFDYYELLELSESIRNNGLIQPLTVRKTGEMYELISGERRLRASICAGLKSIPCILITANDRECSLMCLIENIQRTDLSFFEEADGIKRLMNDFSLSQQEVAEKLGMAQSTLSNKLRLHKLTPDEREKIVASGLTERHARALLRLPDESREDALNKIIAEQLSVKETDLLIDQLLSGEKQKKTLRLGKVGDLRIFSNSITRIIGSMRKSGVNASSSKRETDSYIEYTIIIPKKNEKEPELTVM